MSYAETGGRPLASSYRLGGQTYSVVSNPTGFSQRGVASWYGPGFNGRRTANGEIFDQYELTAAHPTLPLPSYARVTNTRNGRSVIVRINDRGPFHGGRVLDLSRGAAVLLDVTGAGTAPVQIDYIGPAPLNVDDDAFLMASYRDGSAVNPVTQNPVGAVTVASAEAPAPVPTPAPITVASADAPAANAAASTTTAAGSTVTAALAGASVPSAVMVASAEPVRLASAGVGNFTLDYAPAAQENEAVAAVQALATGGASTPAVQIGVFGNADAVARLAATLSAFGEVEVTPVERDGATLSAVRVVAFAHGVTSDAVIAAAAAAGAPGAYLVR